MRGLYFEEMQDGAQFSHPFTRTVTEMDNVLFTSLTMNVAPIHLDEEYAKAHLPQGRRLVNSLFTAALIGGMVNSVAGGGSFLTFPALLVTGVPPITANATSTVALWPGSLASVGAYRREVRSAPYTRLPRWADVKMRGPSGAFSTRSGPAISMPFTTQ